MFFGFDEVGFVGAAEFPGDGFAVGVGGFFLEVPRVWAVFGVAVDTGKGGAIDGRFGGGWDLRAVM